MKLNETCTHRAHAVSSTSMHKHCMPMELSSIPYESGGLIRNKLQFDFPIHCAKWIDCNRLFLALFKGSRELWNLDPHSDRQQITRCIPHEMPASHPRYIMASIRTEWRDCHSHRSPCSIDHHLLPSLSHLRTSSEAWRRSSSSQGIP